MSVRPPVRSWTCWINRAQVSPSRLPGTKARSNRLSASTAVWSQSSPRSRSSGSRGLHDASFLATNPHFSSTWTSRVSGGKRHEFVVEFLGMGPGDRQITCHSVLVDIDQATGGSCPTSFLDVLQNVQGLVVGQAGVFEDGPLALREGALAGAAVDHANPPALATPATEGEII